MKVLNAHHISINVKNLEETLNFYENILGFKKLEFVQLETAELYYYLIPGTNTKLELITYDYEVGEAKDSHLVKGAARHFCFEVDDIKDAEQVMKKAGVKFNSDIVPIDEIKCYSLLVEDPNGFELELVEPYK